MCTPGASEIEIKSGCVNSIFLKLEFFDFMNNEYYFCVCVVVVVVYPVQFYLELSNWFKKKRLLFLIMDSFYNLLDCYRYWIVFVISSIGRLQKNKK